MDNKEDAKEIVEEKNEDNTEEDTEEVIVDNECPVCFEDRKFNITLKPCEHKTACDVCAPQLKFCPRCNVELYITIKFKTSSSIVPLRINPQSTIEQIICDIAADVDRNPDITRLIFAGRVLDSDRKFSDYKIPSDTIVHVVYAIRGD